MTPPLTLWNRSFLLWLLGSAQSRLGSALSGIALSFLVLAQTGSAGATALTLACALAPNLLMPLMGAWVDRVPLKVPLIGAALTQGLLQVAVGGLALAWGEVPLGLVNGAALLAGLANAFAQPASSAAVPALVPPGELARANGVLTSVSQGAWLLGTLAGGALVAAVSPAVAIALDGVSFLVMAGVLTQVALPQARPLSAATPGLLADLRAGLRLMGRSRTLSFTPLIGLLLNATLAPLLVVVPKLMGSLGAGAQGYGAFLALEAAGMVAAGALFAVLGHRLPVRRATAAGLLLTAATYGVMWAWPVLPVVLVGSAVLGFGFGILNAPLNTLLQQLVPAAYRGRVFSVLGMASSLGMPLSLLVVSPWLDRVAAPVWFGAAACLQGLGAVAWVLVVRSERQLPNLQDLDVATA
ncbi:MFS transporter [Deinococcus koreensis]|uniref:MFS transporter n=1 Tax=Deinococcus koreensis TaxID=2054903 RepID=A0A2K3US66_9DEIO|nr:MFS transporter [Deinococcus koreensis]PNY79391.1 MFS transporter [Deinococcus koreensis]